MRFSPLTNPFCPKSLGLQPWLFAPTGLALPILGQGFGHHHPCEYKESERCVRRAFSLYCTPNLFPFPLHPCTFTCAVILFFCFLSFSFVSLSLFNATVVAYHYRVVLTKKTIILMDPGSARQPPLCRASMGRVLCCHRFRCHICQCSSSNVDKVELLFHCC